MPTIHVNPFGEVTYNPCVLLTGAGFSANWRGLLANEVQAFAYQHPLVQKNFALKSLLLKEENYESALGTLQSNAETNTERIDLEVAIESVFLRMDQRIREAIRKNAVHPQMIQQFINRFGPREQREECGLVFTLNQDLLLEYLMNGSERERPDPMVYPGLPAPHFNNVRTGTYKEADRVLIPDAPQFSELKGNLNYVKLHGAFNWRSENLDSIMIMGSRKSEQIPRWNLLQAYHTLFRAILNAGGTRLFVSGYGFGDAHINAAILEAIRGPGLEIYIHNTAGWSRTIDMLRQKHGHMDDWAKGLIGFCSEPLNVLYPSSENAGYVTPSMTELHSGFFSADYVC